MEQENTGFEYKSDSESEESSTQKPQSFHWDSLEYIQHDHKPSWYMILIAGTVLLATASYLLTKSIFSIGLIIIIGITVGIFASRKPKKVMYSISDDGLYIEHKHYPFRNFKSFSIHRDGNLSSVNFVPTKRLSLPVSAFFEPEMESKVISAIGDHLPFEENKVDRIDQLAHKLKL